MVRGAKIAAKQANGIHLVVYPENYPEACEFPSGD
jgi:hypothetical protein